MKFLYAILFFLIPYLSFGQRYFDLSGIALVSSSTLSYTGTITPFLAQVNAYSAYQTIVVSGLAVTANGTVSITGGGIESSLDNNTYSTSNKTLVKSGTTIPSTTVFFRIPNTLAIGSYSGNISVTCPGASPITIPYSATVSSSATEALFMLGNSSSMLSQSGWTRCFNPVAGTSAYTDGTTGWVLHRNASAWAPYFDVFYGYDNNGMTTGTFGSEFPQNVAAGFWINIGGAATFANQGYGIFVDNLPAGQYVVELFGSVNPSFNSGITNPEYRVRFGPTGTVTPVTTLNEQSNTSNYLIFPSTGSGTITAGQSIYISVNAPPSLTPGGGTINAIRIKKVG